MQPAKHNTVTVSTFGDLAARGYDLWATCLPCKRSVSIDPATLPAEKSYIKTALICRQCGKRSGITISPHSKLVAPGNPVWRKTKGE